MALADSQGESLEIKGHLSRRESPSIKLRKKPEKSIKKQNQLNPGGGGGRSPRI